MKFILVMSAITPLYYSEVYSETTCAIDILAAGSSLSSRLPDLGVCLDSAL
jgi:hypothetical protein